MNEDRDKLIAAVYAISMSPEYFDESLDTLDAWVFNKLEKNSKPSPASNSALEATNIRKPHYSIDAELLLHVQRSNEIYERLGRQRTEKSRVELLLDTAPNPALIFDQDENIVAMNDLAKNNPEKTCFEKLADCCTNTHVLEQIRKFMIMGDDQKILVEPGYINTKQSMNTCILVRKIDENLKAPKGSRKKHLQSRYFFTIVNLGFDPSKTELFKETYGLTRAEVAVAVHLASGKQIPEISAARNAKIETIRSQIKVIKSKTHSRDVPSIVRLVCGFSAGILTSSQLSGTRKTYTKKTAVLKRQEQIVLRDGRKMSFLEQGDPNGMPVLMLHTIPHGVELPKEASEYAKRMNLRIISPYRPGYGQSDAYPNAEGNVLLDIVAADMYELLTKLQIDKATIIGVATGAIYAMRFARLFPNRVTNLFAVSRTPMWRDEWIAKLPKLQRLILALARYTPQLMPLVIRATMAYLYKARTKELAKSVCGGDTADALAVQKSEIYDLLANEFKQGLQQGCEAMCSDIFLNVTDFSQEARRLKHPFHILHGDNDKIIAVTQVQAFVESVPGTKLEIVKGAGHLLIYSHWKHVLRAVKKKQKQAYIGK